MSHASRLRYLGDGDQARQPEHRLRHHSDDLIYIPVTAILVAIAVVLLYRTVSDALGSDQIL